MNSEEKLLKILEIELNRVNHLDTILFNIKIWSITLVVALIGFALQYTSGKSKFYLLGIGATIIFFSIDLYFRKIQIRSVHNTNKIRKHLKLTKNSEVLKKLWEKELPERGIYRQFIIDYGYTFGVYALILLTLFILI